MKMSILHLHTPARFAAITLLAMLLGQGPARAQTVTEDRTAFTVIEAPWMVSLENRNLEIRDQQVKHDRKSGYFLLSNEKNGLTVSLFIEPVDKCRTSEECRDFVLKTGNPQWGTVQDVVKSKIDDFSYFEFFRPTVQNLPLQMLDMYAEYVADGYWVDLHISKSRYRKTDHSLFENVIHSIRFVPKTGEPATASEKSISEAQRVVEAWSLLWDSGNYADAYKETSGVTKSKFNEKTWASYWTSERKPLGKLAWRKIINTSLVRALEKASNRPGAVIKYQSSFENREDVFESFYLILEKDGRWRILGYDTNE
jgi:hypothetical protein